MINKTKIYLLSFLGSVLLACQALSLSVQKSNLKEMDGASVLELQFDGPFQPEPDMEDGETILIEFPEDTNWTPPRNKTSNLGLSYNYIPYEDGSGDLVIKKDARLIMGDVIQHDMNHYSITFYANQTEQNPAPMPPPLPPQPQIMPSSKAPMPTATGHLSITRLRVGKKDNGTRFVMDLTRQAKFVVKENSDFTKVYITPAEVAQWIPALASNQQFGVFKGYRIVNQNGDISIELSIEKGTRVRKAQLLGVQNGHPKLVIDLQPKEMRTPHLMAPQSTMNSTDKKQAETPKELPIKSFNILRQNNDTIVRFATSKVENFDIKENTVTNEVTITLPKIDWSHVEILSEKGGLIDGFRIDQSDSQKTNLILNVQKTTRVVGKKGFGRNGMARFVVYLSQGDNKSPSWLVDASAEDLPYDDLEKEEGEVSNVIYRGGIRPYTTIGTGFYVGAKGSSVSGENKAHTTVNGTYTTDLLNNNLGGAAHVFAGYGINFGKLYGGVEADFGIYGVDDKTSFNNGTFYGSSSDIKYMWGISGRLGYYITPTSLLYGRIGAVSGAFQYNGSSISDGEIIFPGNYRRDRRSGFLYGIGLESALNDMFSVRIEGAQINFQTFNYQQGTNSKKERFMLNQISMGGSYKFSPMAGPSVAGVLGESVGSGFYFGLSGGISTLTNHRKVYGIQGVSGIVYDGQGSTLDPSWSVFAGWSEHVDRFFFAGECQLDLTKPIISESLADAGGNVSQSYSNKLRWLWALTGRAGYIFNHGTIGYGRIGIVGGQLAHKGVHNGAARSFAVNGGSNSYALGVRLGAGIETFITDRLTVRGDYVIDYMPGIKIKDKGNNNFYEKITLINNEFKLGLAWYLDP